MRKGNARPQKEYYFTQIEIIQLNSVHLFMCWQQPNKANCRQVLKKTVQEQEI
jgi:hypothetical protein